MDLVERGASRARHPWERARADFFVRLMKRHGLLSEEAAWLDAGAGDGWFAVQLRSRVPGGASITCWDVNYTPEDIVELGSGAPGIEFVSRRPAGTFDRVLLLDVLEHVEDDVTFLRSLVDNVLHKDGFVVISVPAHRALFLAHDEMLGHFRRYAPGGCARVLENAGLRIVTSGGLFLSLLPARAAQALVEKVRRPSGSAGGIGQWRGGRVKTGLFSRALEADASLALWASGRGHALPGLSYWALCRLP